MRRAEISRKTRETEIELSLDLEGAGTAKIECQDQFFRHMMETLAKYGSIDLELRAEGDNLHHLVEDVAIVMGMAVREAMGDIPVRRMGHAVVPMDDALVTVALDVIDRPYVDLEVPDPLYQHFIRSFAMSSGITIHIIQQRGFDEHHVIEATFKALGLALREALVRRDDLLSTKASPEITRG